MRAFYTPNEDNLRVRGIFSVMYTSFWQIIWLRCVLNWLQFLVSKKWEAVHLTWGLFMSCGSLTASWPWVDPRLIAGWPQPNRSPIAARYRSRKLSQKVDKSPYFYFREQVQLLKLKPKLSCNEDLRSKNSEVSCERSNLPWQSWFRRSEEDHQMGFSRSR